MLANELTELLKHDVGEVLKSRLLLMSMLRIYSSIFLHDQPCSTCEKKHAAYYQRLASEGHKMITKLNIMEAKKTKYKFKTEGTVIQTPFGDYLQSTLTDEIVEKICAHSPRFRNQFINPPDLIQEKTVEVKPKDIAPVDVAPKEVEAKQVEAVKPSANQEVKKRSHRKKSR